MGGNDYRVAREEGWFEAVDGNKRSIIVNTTNYQEQQRFVNGQNKWIRLFSKPRVVLLNQADYCTDVCNMKLSSRTLMPFGRRCLQLVSTGRDAEKVCTHAQRRQRTGQGST